MMPGKKEFDVNFWVTDNLIAYSLLSKSSDSVINVINAIRKNHLTNWTYQNSMEIQAKACAELFRTVDCLELATYTNSHPVTNHMKISKPSSSAGFTQSALSK